MVNSVGMIDSLGWLFLWRFVLSDVGIFVVVILLAAGCAVMVAQLGVVRVCFVLFS